MKMQYLSQYHLFTLFLILIIISTTTNASYSRTPSSSPPQHPYDPPTFQHPPSTSSLAYEFLAPHNAVRASHGLHPLSWDPKLANYAQWWANQRRYDCNLQHSTNNPYGENIFWGSGSEWTPQQAVNDWIIEGRWYDYSTNSCMDGHDCGHYTQIVWRDTRRVGCAKVVCFNDAGVFITCNYDPPGNYVGEKPY